MDRSVRTAKRLGYLWGGTLAVLSIYLGGGGHGWVAAFLPSLLTIYAVPKVVVAWALQDGSMARKNLLIAVLLNVLLFFSTWLEGFNYLLDLWSTRAAVLIVIWGVLWSTWFILAVGFYFRVQAR